MPHPPPLTGVVVACNEADRIERCVASLRAICAEVLVVDSGSTDATRERAEALGARVIEQPWLGFARQKNLAISLATQPWVLLLDADEWLDEDALEAMRALFASGRLEAADVVTLRRRTRFLGSVMRYGSFAAEPVERLFRAHCRHEELAVHERLDTRGQRVITSSVRMEHDTARSEAEYWAKLQRYARLWAEERTARATAAEWRVRVPPGRASAAALAYLLKNLVLRLGVLDGPGGDA